MRTKKKLYMIVFVWLLSMLHSRFALCETLIIQEDGRYAVTPKLYASVSEYQCVGWNIFYTDTTTKDRYFFFVKFFYSHCLSPWQDLNYRPSSKSCSIDAMAQKFAQRLSLKTDMTNNTTVFVFDTLVVVNEKGAWLYEGGVMLEMFALHSTPVAAHSTNQGYLNINAVPVSKAPAFSTDSLQAYFWRSFKESVSYRWNALYLIHRLNNKVVFARTAQNCKHCRIYYNRFFVFDVEKGIVQFFAPAYILVAGPNMLSFEKYYVSKDMYWFE